MKNLVEEKSPQKVERTITVHILKPAEILGLHSVCRIDQCKLRRRGSCKGIKG